MKTTTKTKRDPNAEAMKAIEDSRKLLDYIRSTLIERCMSGTNEKGPTFNWSGAGEAQHIRDTLLNLAMANNYGDDMEESTARKNALRAAGIEE